MLSFNLRLGDDVWFGKFGSPLDGFQQLTLKEANDRHLTVFTPEEIIDIPFDGDTVDSGIFGVRIAAQPDDMDSGLFSIGMDAPDDVQILRGRVYRRQLDG
jgi:hypothetical protein